MMIIVIIMIMIIMTIIRTMIIIMIMIMIRIMIIMIIMIIIRITIMTMTNCVTDTIHVISNLINYVSLVLQSTYNLFLMLNPLLFYSQRGILYYSTPREESFTILLPERNPLLSTPREESFTILLRERNPLLFYSQRGILITGRRGPERSSYNFCLI